MTRTSTIVLQLVAMVAALTNFLLAGDKTAPASQPTTSTGASKSPFIFVLIDDKTEQVFGRFPYDRSVCARAVERAAILRAKSVVLKFFLDLPKTPDGDKSLATAMQKIDVVLQAGISDKIENPNELPAKFNVDDPNVRDYRGISGSTGYIPLPMFSAVAADVGFANIENVELIPVLENYRGNRVKSLWASCLELATGKRLRLEPGHFVQFGEQRIAVNGSSAIPVHFPAHDSLPYISFVDFMSRNPPAADIENHIVIIGYDGLQNPLVDSPLGKLKVDRIFFYGLLSAYDQLWHKSD